jgi:hypothetical protein
MAIDLEVRISKGKTGLFRNSCVYYIITNYRFFHSVGFEKIIILIMLSSVQHQALPTLIWEPIIIDWH